MDIQHQFKDSMPCPNDMIITLDTTENAVKLFTYISSTKYRLPKIAKVVWQCLNKG